MRNEQGNWVEGRMQLLEMVLNFYNDLFAADPNVGGNFI